MRTIALKTIPKIMAKILFILCLGVLTAGILSANSLPQTLWVTKAEDIPLPTKLPLVAKADQIMTAGTAQPEAGYNASIKLFGVIPIANTHVQVAEEDYVIAGGTPFGIKILAEGVLVVGFNDVQTNSGNANPAKEAGLKEGDLLLAVDSATVSTNAGLQEIVKKSDGESLRLTVKRGEKNLTLTLTPVLATDGCYRAGMWVRDSTAGLGTMTFYHPATGVFGGLGHAVCDSDTGEIMSLLTGEIVGAKILGLEKATAGTAGEIKGALIDNLKVGSILENCQCGVYGQLTSGIPDGEAIRVARKQEVQTGAAQILSCVTGETKSYDCEIEKINLNDSSTQNLVIRVTDPDLLAATGGIVQGMSGSPIIQNGLLVGAVTHVFINQPEKGYGVFADTMLWVARQTAKENLDLVS